MRNNMQTETIIKITKFKLEFEKFKDWVYIKLSGEENPYLLPRKYFDKMEAKHAEGKVKYNWLLKIDYLNKYYAVSKDYLKNYFKTGNWGEMVYTCFEDPLPLLKKGAKDRFYQMGVYEDGFLKFNNKRVIRPFTFDIGRYHSIKEVIKKLRKHPKILKVTYVQDMWGIERDHSLTITYMPSIREFNILVAKDYLTCPQLYIEPHLGIKRFKDGDNF